MRIQAGRVYAFLSEVYTAMATFMWTPMFSRQRVFGERSGQTDRGEYEGVRVESAAVLGAAGV